MATIVSCEPRHVVGGVDTHKDVHVAAVIDAVGRSLASESFPTSARATDACSAGCALTASSWPWGWKAPGRGVPGWLAT